MRTTLDLDDRLLALARTTARARGTSIGRVVSELALRGHEASEARSVEAVGDFPMLPAVPGHIITAEAVAAALADDD